MGSGEGDAIKVKITDNTANTGYPTVGSITWPNYTGDYWTVKDNNTMTWTYTNTVYLYQLICPKRNCKTSNWCELDKMVKCKGCGATLKAVSELPDFEIPVK